MNIEEITNLNPKDKSNLAENSTANAAFLTVSSEYFSVNINSDTASTNSGSLVDENQYEIAYAWPYTPFTSYTTVRIDGVNYLYAYQGDVVQKLINITPALSESAYRFGDIVVTQNVQVIYNPYTGRADMGKYTYTVANHGTVAHSVGIRIMQDTTVDGNDAPQFVIAGSKAPLEYETEFTGSSIPEYFVAYKDYPRDLNTLGLGILKEDNRISPSKVFFGTFANVYAHEWEITPINPLGNTDNAFAVYFGEKSIAPNTETMFTTFYGLGAAVSIPFGDTVTLTTSEESCIINTTSSVDVEAASNIFAYKYSYNENDCNDESLVRGDVIGFTLVFGNYGPLDYTASVSENTIVDTLSIAAPMNLQVVSMSIGNDLSLIDLASGSEITVGTVLTSGEYYLQVLKLLDDGTFTGAFDLEANSVYSISMLLQIQF